MKQISEEQIEEILNHLNNYRFIPIKKALKELPDIENKRLEELENFASEVKRRVRSTGRSMVIGISDFEDLFVKYKINLK